jgi:hypothetical protein
VLERTLYQERPARYEYRLTGKGLDLWPTVVALMQWGDRYTAPTAGAPTLIEHRGCGGSVDEHRICSTFRAMPRSAWISSNRRTPSISSRTISSDQRSPTTSSAPAMLHTWVS